MQWIKDKVGRPNGGVDDKQNFMVGSDKWMGSSHNPTAPRGSFKNPEAAEAALQSYNSQPNPYVSHSQSLAAVNSDESAYKNLAESKSKKLMYPNVYDNSDAEQTTSEAESKPAGSDEEEEEEVLTASQVLVTIPGAIMHLIDDEESVHLASGDFSLVRLVQDKTKVAVIAKVGEELKWPLVQEEPAVKLDPTHYYFSLKVPKDMGEGSSLKGQGTSFETDAREMDTLNYGLTFPAGLAEEHSAKIRELDYFLERYSTFSAPTLKESTREMNVEPETVEKVPPSQDRSFPGKVVSQETVSGDVEVAATEETCAAFWTTVAPNVADYNSTIAKGIAIGAGHIIRGIFWFSDSTVTRLDSGKIYMKSKFKPKKEKSKISPLTIASVRRVRKLSGMTDKVSAGVLGGVLYTTGLVSSAVVHSPPGKSFFKLMPGEVALVSLDAFGRVFDAIEKAGRSVAGRSSSVTQDFVNYRYGEQAKELTDESFRTVGHVAATAWTVTKIRKALNPSKTKITKTGIVKSLAKSAVSGKKL